MCIDLVLADPYPMMLEGLSHVFHESPDFAVKSCVRDGDAALRALQRSSSPLPCSACWRRR